MAALLPLTTGAADAQTPTFLDVEAVVYATADEPFELAFGADGTLYAGRNSPSNGPAQLLRVPPDAASAELWGSVSPSDPDGLDYFDGAVFCSSEGDIYEVDPDSGAMSVWANVSGAPNQSSLVVDAAGDYAPAGSIFVGNARFGTDIHLVSLPGKTVSTFVSSPSLSAVRGLQFVAGKLYFTEVLGTKGVWTADVNGNVSRIADGGRVWDVPDGLAYDARTDSFLIGDGTAIYRLPRTGGPVETVGTGFGAISGLAFGPDGALYIADRGAGVIWRVGGIGAEGRAVPAVPSPIVPALAGLLIVIAGGARAVRPSRS